MTEVSATLRSRWRSKKHVGPATPTQIVEIQKGKMIRDYRIFEFLDGHRTDFGEISKGKHNLHKWQATWDSDGDWLVIPNVSHVSLDDNMDETGLAEPTACTITIENVVMKQITGVGGIFHQIKRGALAPFYGFRFGRSPDPGAPTTDPTWFNVLNGGCRVRIRQGYGADALEPTFMGLIDDTDVKSSPDQITVTCRSFGALLTDQRLFGHNKAKEIPSPVIFADRLQSDNTHREGGAADASSADSRHPARNVQKAGSGSFWLSDGHAGQANTEWIEIHVPKGRYETLYIDPQYGGMEAFLGVYVRSRGLPGGATVDDLVVPDGWLDLGLGNVPGANGGWPIARHWKALDKGGQSKRFLFKLNCGNDTVLRIGFRNLGFSPGKNDFRARVGRMYAMRRVQKTVTKQKHWVLVDDAADVVKWILMWAGFKEWKVDPMRVRLKDNMVFHQADYMIDVIKHMLEQANYVFYIDQPSDDPDSIGVPHFSKSRSVAPPGRLEEVRSSDLLTGIETKFSKANLSYVIRTRGAMAKKGHGASLGEDKSRRVQATYYPPWSGAHHSIKTGKVDKRYPTVFADRLAGVVKHVTHTDPSIASTDEAMMSNVLIALAEAVTAFGGTIDIPGYPGFNLNGHVSIVDTPSGTNTRMWIRTISSSFTAGQQAEWKTTLGGALIDTPDILALAFDYIALLERVVSEFAV